jgi:VWFA-related protein
MKTRDKIAFVFLVAAAINGAALFSFAQAKKKEGLDYQISVSAISIAVTVQDKGGSYIDNLTAGDFTIYENNVKQALTYFEHDFAAPLSLTVLLDVSGSMAIQDKLKESKEALAYLLTRLLGPEDEVSLLIFADGEVEVAAGFSTDKKKFLIELEETEAYGQTALYDAVAVSPEFANKGKKEKRGLLLITDGIENDSLCTPSQAVEIARRVDVPIYTIGYKVPLSEQYLRKYKSRSDTSSAGIIAVLERFSRATGGKAFFLNEAHELTAALREIKRELSHQYILGYTSYKTSKNEYRRIRVVTRDKKHRVRTREGY